MLVHFTRKKAETHNPEVAIQIGDTAIHPMMEAKYQGAIFDQKLKFQAHLNHAIRHGSRVQKLASRDYLRVESSRVRIFQLETRTRIFPSFLSRVEFELDPDSTRTRLDSTRKTRPELCIGTVTYVCGFLDVGSDIIRYTDS